MAKENTLSLLADELATGATTAEDLVDECLARIEDLGGEGSRAFLSVDGDVARKAARAMDALRDAGAEPSPYAGIPVSVKDLFDVRGQVTRAGSRVLDQGPAARDAIAVDRLRRAGLVVIGRTNMTEFAFSGLGINPHFGTPANPWDRGRGRIPGGSSSGAAVSVADGMAYGALGSDTGGSCRIPAALCGLAGFKPTQSRVPRDGMVPLSPTLDAVGVIAHSVGCCAVLDSLLSGEPTADLAPLLRPPQLAVPSNYFVDGSDSTVAAAFDRAVSRLADAGAGVVKVELPELDGIADMNAGGGFPGAESFAWHRDLTSTRASDYDPRVLVRVLRGERQSACDLLALSESRQRLVAGVRARLEGFDAFVAPTVPIVAPALDAFEEDDEYSRLNLLMLRNPTVVNLLDGCAVSLPMHEEPEPPSGLMLAGFAGADARLLRIASWAEERLCAS